VIAPFNLLQGLTCASATSCWAFGAIDGPASGGKQVPQSLHWNGRHWSAVAVPSPKSVQQAEVGGVACAPHGPCLLGLTTYDAVWKQHVYTVRWNGRAWVG
jgi:hypothetical protein